MQIIVFMYIDDVLIIISNEEERNEHLRTLFKKLYECGLTINLEKYTFGVSNIDFLGHVFENGIKMSAEWIKIVKEFDPPQKVKQLQKLVGMINYYHK